MFRLLLVLSVFLLLCATGLAESPWRALAPKAAGFSVSMPGKAAHRRQMVPTAAGKVTQNLYSLDLGSRVFIVSYADHPRAISRQALGRVVAAWDAKARPARRRDVLRSGKPGVVGDFRRGGFLGRCMAIGSGRRLYQVVYMARNVSGVPAEAERFLGSFALR